MLKNFIRPSVMTLEDRAVPATWISTELWPSWTGTEWTAAASNPDNWASQDTPDADEDIEFGTDSGPMLVDVPLECASIDIDHGPSATYSGLLLLAEDFTINDDSYIKSVLDTRCYGGDFIIAGGTTTFDGTYEGGASGVCDYESEDWGYGGELVVTDDAEGVVVCGVNAFKLPQTIDADYTFAEDSTTTVGKEGSFFYGRGAGCVVTVNTGSDIYGETFVVGGQTYNGMMSFTRQTGNLWVNFSGHTYCNAFVDSAGAKFYLGGTLNNAANFDFDGKSSAGQHESFRTDDDANGNKTEVNFYTSSSVGFTHGWYGADTNVNVKIAAQDNDLTLEAGVIDLQASDWEMDWDHSQVATNFITIHSDSTDVALYNGSSYTAHLNTTGQGCPLWVANTFDFEDSAINACNDGAAIDFIWYLFEAASYIHDFAYINVDAESTPGIDSGLWHLDYDV